MSMQPQCILPDGLCFKINGDFITKKIYRKEELSLLLLGIISYSE